ncbi:hypothetical protein EQG73_01790 [Clostridium tetani]|nr:hypothetical protein EQG73_01790 [Clostridium tetani]QBD86452.1 hypothetical protein EW636_01790 [Clostridium tetani]
MLILGGEIMAKRKKRKKNSSKKITICLIIAAVLIGLTSVKAGYSYNNIKHYENLFYPGITVGNEDISGKTLEEGRKIIKEKYANKLLNKKITVKIPEGEYSITFDKIEGKYDIDNSLKKAYDYGKDSNAFSKYRIIKKAEKKPFELMFSYNEKKVIDFINDVEKKVNKDATNAKLIKKGENFNIIPESVGKKLNKEKLQKDILTNINGDISKDLVVNGEVKNVQAKVTSDKLTSVNSLIASFGTNYANISSQQRANNIRLSTESINGTVLMPGEVFSFNGAVGERTADRGYQAASVIIGNQVEDGLGGGICQTSSTLYNAALKANLKSVERAHHTLPSSYIPLGRDATVDWENIDYKFRNDYSFPIYIEGLTQNGEVRFNIYSHSSVKNRRYEITTDVYENLPTDTKTIQDANLSKGTTEVVQKPYQGFKVKVYRNIYENEKFINKELISNDFYRPIQGIIKVGTKK